MLHPPHLPDRPFLDAHDGVIARYELVADGGLTLHFASMSVFLPSPGEPDILDVWLYRTELTLGGVSRLVMEGLLRETDTVSDLDLEATDGASIELADLLTPTPLAGARLQLAGSGATIEVRCTTGHVILVERLRWLETWNGPLRGVNGAAASGVVR